MRLVPGDRVRVIAAKAEYTGCRGSIVPGPGAHDESIRPLGYYVAIDGENGVARPFLSSELEPLVLARARRHRQMLEREGA